MCLLVDLLCLGSAGHAALVAAPAPASRLSAPHAARISHPSPPHLCPLRACWPRCTWCGARTCLPTHSWPCEGRRTCWSWRCAALCCARCGCTCAAHAVVAAPAPAPGVGVVVCMLHCARCGCSTRRAGRALRAARARLLPAAPRGCSLVELRMGPSRQHCAGAARHVWAASCHNQLSTRLCRPAAQVRMSEGAMPPMVLAVGQPLIVRNLALDSDDVKVRWTAWVCSSRRNVARVENSVGSRRSQPPDFH